MNPFMYQMYANIINDCIPKIKEQKPDTYYKNIPKSERKKVGTGVYRNGKEVMATESRGEKNNESNIFTRTRRETSRYFR